MKTLKQVKGKIKWKRPKRDSEHGEIFTQLSLSSKHPKIDKIPHDVAHEMAKMQDGDIYDHAIKHGKVKKISPEKAKDIYNHTSEAGAWEHLNPDKKKNILKHAARGKMEMPIILQNRETKKRWMLAGNTRLTFNSQIRKKKTPCLIVKY